VPVFDEAWQEVVDGLFSPSSPAPEANVSIARKAARNAS
jgi:hypothetical protein